MKPSLPIPLVAAMGAILLGTGALGIFLLRAGPPAATPTVAQVAFPKAFEIDPGTITAKSAIVYDPTNGRVLYAKDADESRPLASLTKLMSAQVVLSGTHLSLASPITINQADMAVDGDAGDWGFKVGDVAELGDLIKYGLVASSNDAMAAAAASLGGDYISQMNSTAASLGLTHTYFLNPTGLDLDTETSGAYGSAEDVAKLASVFLKEYPQFFELTAKPSVSIETSGGTLLSNATAAPLLDIPGFIGAKTGYTDLAGGNLVAAFDIDLGHPVVVVVLGSSESGRFDDIRSLIYATRLAQL